VRRHGAGKLDLIVPTLKNLEAIARFATASDLMAAAAAAEVPAILPRITVEGEGVRIVLPGDPPTRRPPAYRRRALPGPAATARPSASRKARRCLTL